MQIPVYCPLNGKTEPEEMLHLYNCGIVKARKISGILDRHINIIIYHMKKMGFKYTRDDTFVE